MEENGPHARIAEAKRLAVGGSLHGEVLSETVNDGYPSVRVETLMALDAQPVCLADFEIVRRLQYDPTIDVRIQCAVSLVRFGPIAEPTLIRMLENDPADHRFELAMAVAISLGKIGGKASLAPLEAAARTDAPFKTWRWYAKQTQKEALLSIEARLGLVHPRPRRAGLWEETPTDRNRAREPVAGYWLLAREERLRGDLLRDAIHGSAEIWDRRQALMAAFEQETDLEDLFVILEARNDPNAAVRGSSADVLWRYGAAAEASLIEAVFDFERKAASPAIRALGRIGSAESLEPLRNLLGSTTIDANRYHAQRAIEAVEAWSRTLV